MITAAEIGTAVEGWIFEKRREREAAKGRIFQKPRWWSPDWSESMWSSVPKSFEIPGLEHPLEFVERYVPAGEDYDDFSGPQYLIFRYQDRWFAKAGRNISHVGAEFEGQFYEVAPEQMTRTHWARVDDGKMDYDLDEESR